MARAKPERTKHPGVYKRATNRGTVYDITYRVNGEQVWLRGLPGAPRRAPRPGAHHVQRLRRRVGDLARRRRHAGTPPREHSRRSQARAQVLPPTSLRRSQTAHDRSRRRREPRQRALGARTLEQHRPAHPPNPQRAPGGREEARPHQGQPSKGRGEAPGEAEATTDAPHAAASLPPGRSRARPGRAQHRSRRRFRRTPRSRTLRAPLVERRPHRGGGIAPRRRAVLQRRARRPAQDALRRRNLVLTPEAAEALRSQQIEGRSSADGLVFPSPTGTYWRASNFNRRRWQAIRERAELPELHFHDLRHFFVSYVSAMKLPPALTKQLTGHTDDATHDGYTYAIPGSEPILRAAFAAANAAREEETA
jgi:hypothetical protein